MAVFIGLCIILSLYSIILSSIQGVTALEEPQISSTEDYQLLFMGLIILILVFIAVIINSILVILFGVGIKRLQEHVKYARITGILYIISGATMIIGIGFILFYITNFFSIALLFDASKKYNKK